MFFTLSSLCQCQPNPMPANSVTSNGGVLICEILDTVKGNNILGKSLLLCWDYLGLCWLYAPQGIWGDALLLTVQRKGELVSSHLWSIFWGPQKPHLTAYGHCRPQNGQNVQKSDFWFYEKTGSRILKETYNTLKMWLLVYCKTWSHLKNLFGHSEACGGCGCHLWLLGASDNLWK